MKLFLEIGPLAVFFIVYRMYADETVTIGGAEYAGVVLATVAFVPAILAALFVSWRREGKVPRMAAVTAVIVVVFGGLTVWLNDATFIKMKPTIVYLIFASLLGWGLLRGKSNLKLVLGDTLPMTDRGWMIFTRRWVWFFLFMAVLNEVIWRTQSEAFWVNFKVFGAIPLTLAFTFSQLGLLKAETLETDEPES